MNQLLLEIDKYKELLDKKDELAEITKETNKALDAQKKIIAQMMIDEECPSIERSGFKYTLQESTKYSKRSDEYLARNGLDFFEVLRSEGLGSLIKENVNAQSLSSAMKNYVEENGELSAELESVLSVYEDMNITKRMVSRK